MKALVLRRSLPRFAAAKIAGKLPASLPAHLLAPLELAEIEEPSPPGKGWVSVTPLLSGICGSDLAAISGAASMSFEEMVTFPFVPGHEVFGIRDDTGDRVVIKALLTCLPRGLPPCSYCQEGRTDLCLRLESPGLSKGPQIGYCADLPGGWSQRMLAHESQVVPVPDDLDPMSASLVEPLACCVHAVVSAGLEEGAKVGVIGAGAMGLLATYALSSLSRPGLVVVAAKHGVQKRLANQLGAHEVVDPGGLANFVRLRTKAFVVGGTLSAGLDVCLDCVGTKASFELATAVTRPGGRVVLVGLPSPAYLDLSTVWMKQINVAGAYAYGRDEATGKDSFEVAIELAAGGRIRGLVSRAYPLDDYRTAIHHASMAGRLGAVKIAFMPNQRLLRELLGGDR
jgi:threonine dehydrogenase-like Zn-dependent dehydrogenase